MLVLVCVTPFRFQTNYVMIGFTLAPRWFVNQKTSKLLLPRSMGLWLAEKHYYFCLRLALFVMVFLRSLPFFYSHLKNTGERGVKFLNEIWRHVRVGNVVASLRLIKVK